MSDEIGIVVVFGADMPEFLQKLLLLPAPMMYRKDEGDKKKEGAGGEQG